GDSAGWVIPPYPTYYTSWSDSHIIREGDTLGQKIIIDVHGASLQNTPAPSASPPKISSRSFPNGYAPQPSGVVISRSSSIDVPSPTPLGGPASPSSSQGVKCDIDVSLLDKSNSFSTKDQHKPHERNVHNQEAFSTNQLLYNPSNIWNSNNYLLN
ncbi:hypothetical protein RYX36_020126, partial [Vicia faba]